jgi:peptidoglycan/LPS O-acetylase OafA/YrhL
LFKRKPSALAPLDGIRFMAVMWVFLMHATMNVFFFYKCSNIQNPFYVLQRNGDMGVDIFFVLSGFLIAFVLNREYEKHGDIDWAHFMKMRFLRLYPGLCSFLIPMVLIGMI